MKSKYTVYRQRSKTNVLLFYVIVIPSSLLFFSNVGNVDNVDNVFNRAYPAVSHYRQVDDINPIWAPDGWTLAFERLNKSGFSGQEIYSFMPFSREKRVEPIAISSVSSISSISSGQIEPLELGMEAHSKPFYAGYMCWSNIGKNRVLKYIYSKLPDLYLGTLPILYNSRGEPIIKENLFISGKKELESFENKYPDWSPDGSKIVFVSGATGNGDIYLKDYNDYDLNTRETIKTSIKSAKRITYSDALDLSPKWSPDGDQITYVSYKNGNSDIFLIKNLKASKPTAEIQLTYSSLNETNPVWSPDGTKIAFYILKSVTSESMEDLCDLWIIDSDGKKPRKIADDVYRQEKQGPTWLPSYSGHSSQRLIYIDSNLDKVYIYTIDEIGTTKTQLRGLSGYKYGHITDIACSSTPERSYFKNGVTRIPLNIAYSALNKDGEKRIYWEKIDLKTLTVIPEKE